jgi:peptidoglycan-associated lipoprotein
VQRIPPPDPCASRGIGEGAANGRQVTQVDIDGAKTRDPLADPAGPLAKRSIYFDFDSFVIRDEFRPVVEAHAKFLNTNQNRKVVIQGNTDDRGSREYNLALGQKRSEAVRRALAALGVSESQVEAVSFGKEKLRALGSDEAAHAENRRADIVYQ